MANATFASVRTLPEDSDWSPADLHIHSRASDGTREVAELVQPLADLGYRIVYFTDHTDLAQARYPVWSNYARYIAGATAASPRIKFYPGSEFTVVNDAGDSLGDILAYGVSSYSGLTNKLYHPQAGIDNVRANNPAGPSSPSIAHPYRTPPWADWAVTQYSGYELMSGAAQPAFANTSKPLTRWRSELLKQRSTTDFASARTGSDWHQNVAVDPEHPGYVTWVNTGLWFSKFAVDMALAAGKTVASRKGSLGYMTLTFGPSTKGIGERLTGVPPGGYILLTITFMPVSSSWYSVVVYDENLRKVFDDRGASYTALHPYTLTGSFQVRRGSHYYYLYIHTYGDSRGDEYVYSSPVFVSTT